MSREWGRSDIAGRWLSTKPVWVAAAFALGLAGAMAAVLYHYATVWTPLQRAYAPAYVRAAALHAIGVTTPGRYRLLQVVTPSGHRVPLEEEVHVRAWNNKDEPSLELSDLALRMGAKALVWEVVSADAAALHALLRHWIYNDVGLQTRLWRPLWTGPGATGGKR